MAVPARPLSRALYMACLPRYTPRSARYTARWQVNLVGGCRSALWRTMAIRSRREAQRLGRLGGYVSSRQRVSDSAWGLSMFRRRAALATHRHYPELTKAWAKDASRARRGLPPLTPEIPEDLLRPGSRITRRRRRLAKAQREYDLATQRARSDGQSSASPTPRTSRR